MFWLHVPLYDRALVTPPRLLNTANSKYKQLMQNFDLFVVSMYLGASINIALHWRIALPTN